MTVGARMLAAAAGAQGLDYATWNPADKSADITLLSGDLEARNDLASGAGWRSVRSTVGVASGKWYWEYRVQQQSADADSGYHMYGSARAAAALSSFIGSDAEGWAYFDKTGEKYTGGSPAAYGDAYALNDIISVALDADAGRLWWAKNGVWQASGDPAAGTNPAFTGLSGTIYAGVGLFADNTIGSRGAVLANFGETTFAHAVPSGFNAGLYDG